MSYYNYYNYKRQPTIEEKKIKLEKYVAKEKKKGFDFHPIPEGSKLGTTWWGKAWKEKINTYADLSNRILRGSSYVKNGFVIHHIINKGQIYALVFGSRAKPYKVMIKIEPLNIVKANEVSKICKQKIDSLQDLIDGKISDDLKDIIIKDLFPNQDEISFLCECPDSAYLCKHIAASLYAIGIAFDKDPSLFFKLRGIDINEFVKTIVVNESKKLLNKKVKTTKRRINKEDAKKLFGI